MTAYLFQFLTLRKKKSKNFEVFPKNVASFFFEIAGNYALHLFQLRKKNQEKFFGIFKNYEIEKKKPQGGRPMPNFFS